MFPTTTRSFPEYLWDRKIKNQDKTNAMVQEIDGRLNMTCFKDFDADL